MALERTVTPPKNPVLSDEAEDETSLWVCASTVMLPVAVSAASCAIVRVLLFRPVADEKASARETKPMPSLSAAALTSRRESVVTTIAEALRLAPPSTVRFVVTVMVATASGLPMSMKPPLNPVVEDVTRPSPLVGAANAPAPPTPAKLPPEPLERSSTSTFEPLPAESMSRPS